MVSRISEPSTVVIIPKMFLLDVNELSKGQTWYPCFEDIGHEKLFCEWVQCSHVLIYTSETWNLNISSWSEIPSLKLTWIPKMMVWKGNCLKRWQLLVSMLVFGGVNRTWKPKHVQLKSFLKLWRLWLSVLKQKTHTSRNKNRFGPSLNWSWPLRLWEL